MPLSNEQQRKIIENVIGGKNQFQQQGGMFQQLGQKFGAFGEMIGMVADVLTGGRPPRRKDVEDAVQILTEQGANETPRGPPPAPESGIPPVRMPPVQRPRRPVPSQPPAISTRRAADPPRVRGAEPWPEEGMITTLPTRIRGAYEFIPADITGMSPMILTPESSNIYGVSYDYHSQVLMVQFNAPSPVIGYKEMTSVCSGERYQCGIRPHSPGPIYSYGGAGRGVPPATFEAMVNAASKGQFLWENIRICGTQHGHRFSYTLTDVPEGQTIPRKATRRGLRVRVVPNVGQGRRGGRKSTLPESIR